MPRPLRLALAALAALPLLAQAPAPSPTLAQPASPEAFRIVNGTGADAVALHAVRSGRPDWGSNLLSRGLLAPDARFALRPAPSAGCRFDLRLVLEDGREAVLREQDICANREVRLANAAVVTPRPDAPPRTPQPPPPAAGGGPQPNTGARVASGTGFVVARDVVLTNQHVVEGCNRILVRTADGRTLAATPPARVDQRRDLALLTVPGDPGPPLTFRTNEVRRGEAVVTYGFPLSGVLSSGPTLTTGEVSALAGMQDNPVQFQISAPVQPGNSGGPLLDRQGHVVGIVVSKLNAQRIAARTGDIPQNVNFAVKGTEAMDFLRRAGLTPLAAESLGVDRSAAEVGETAHRSTLFIRCER
ncbi:S1C family serine protease [Plastoroseomonas arctica]|nr:trypsin-like peptidase domain-containing protein [Plastoroseomonas arctica]